MKHENHSTSIAAYRRPAFAGFRRTATLAVCGVVAALAMPSASLLAATTVEVTDFGSNPGNLKMFKHIPDGMPTPSPLVVIMHGCTQNARTFTDESGWTSIADRFHFALVMPEQQQANNPNKCFNWYVVGNISRDQGEALSIKQMVDQMKADHSIDATRIFATGLSAGGAMTSVMLAAYPDVFAGGGIVAGLPYGCAQNLTDALQCMSTGHPLGGPLIGLSGSTLPGLPGGVTSMPLAPGWCLFFPLLCGSSSSGGSQSFTPAEWGDFVRQASGSAGPFPRVSIWHGSADTTVNPINATSEMEQWTNVHGIDPNSGTQDTVKSFPHQVFKDAAGRATVETYSITGMPHGDPVDPGAAPDQCGTADQFVLNVHICSSLFIARFWGLAP
jgi:poly(hydroxyalkanoate) depolymerase family esterase